MDFFTHDFYHDFREKISGNIKFFCSFTTKAAIISTDLNLLNPEGDRS